MKTSKLTPSVFVLLLSLLATIALAQPQGQGPGQCQGQGQRNGKGPKGDPIERLTERLDLTPQQADQVKANHLSMMKKAQPIKNQIGEKQAKLKTISSLDNPNKKEVEKLANEIADLRGQIFVMHALNRLETRAILNEEQRVIFDAMEPRMGHKMKFKG